jgi:hypothetical protein
MVFGPASVAHSVTATPERVRIERLLGRLGTP